MTTTIHSCSHIWSGKQVNLTADGKEDAMDITIAIGGFHVVSGRKVVLNPLPASPENNAPNPSEIVLVIDAHNNKVVVSTIDDSDPSTRVVSAIKEKEADTAGVILIRRAEIKGFGLIIEDRD